MKHTSKKSVTIDAIQWRGDNHQGVIDFAGDSVPVLLERDSLIIKASGGFVLEHFDYLIKEDGMLRPCKCEIFEATYVALK